MLLSVDRIAYGNYFVHCSVCPQGIEIQFGYCFHAEAKTVLASSAPSVQFKAPQISINYSPSLSFSLPVQEKEKEGILSTQSYRELQKMPPRQPRLSETLEITFLGKKRK